MKNKLNKKEKEELKKDMKDMMDAGRLMMLQKMLAMERNPEKINEIGKEIDKVIKEINDEWKKNNES